MDAKKLAEITEADFFTGVPDSRLKAFCDYLFQKYGTDPRHHIIGANEGNCTALAAGYYLSTGRVPAVYMQNSGLGNALNPAVSLLHEKVYGIPCIFIIGWRGEPGESDEPQHAYQGEITLTLLREMGIEHCIVDRETTEKMLRDKMEGFKKRLERGRSAAFVVRKGALTYDGKADYGNCCTMKREEILRHIVKISGEDPIVSTTGKTSRELFEIRNDNGQGHESDFLTVGSMGHCSSIALGIALNKPDTKVWCIDGDGAMVMHMGAMAVIGRAGADNLVHIVINNEAHESVGGMPTAACDVKLTKVAEGCGYKNIYCVSDFGELDKALKTAKRTTGLVFMEVKAAIGARNDLGRPTKSPKENKELFMRHIKGQE